MSYAFDEKLHVHTYDGKRMYGVTSVLKAWGDKSQLVNWSANCAVDYIIEKAPLTAVPVVLPEGMKIHPVSPVTLEEARTAHTRKRDKAGDNGTQVHADLEVMMNHWIEGKTGEYDPIVTKVKNWMLDNGITPLKSEMPVYSKDLWYAGIADGVIEKDGKKYILDFKTSGYVYTTAFYQCGAYSYAVKEMVAFDDGRYPDGVVIVHIPRGTSFNPEKNVYWRYDIAQLENAFVSILETYKIDQDLQKLIKW